MTRLSGHAKEQQRMEIVMSRSLPNLAQHLQPEFLLLRAQQEPGAKPL